MRLRQPKLLGIFRLLHFTMPVKLVKLEWRFHVHQGHFTPLGFTHLEVHFPTVVESWTTQALVDLTHGTYNRFLHPEWNFGVLYITFGEVAWLCGIKMWEKTCGKLVENWWKQVELYFHNPNDRLKINISTWENIQIHKYNFIVI